MHAARTNGVGVNFRTMLAALSIRASLTLAVLPALLLIAACPAQAQTETVLHRFTGTRDGYDFTSPLTSDGAGNFYGTTSVGGRGYGTVYELSPKQGGGWKQTVLHTFTNARDGAYPSLTSLIFDKQGNLYGVTSEGGANNFGVVFKLHPVGRHWAETVLYSFASGAGGVYPFNGPIMDAEGNLYGRNYVYTESGISEGVFELSPSKRGWTEKVIYDNGINTGNPDGGGITMDTAGRIFGVYWTTFAPSAAFELLPNGKGGWNSKVIYTFDENIFPIGVPQLDKSGNLYGTAQSRSSPGMVYQLSPGKNGQWSLKTLYAFEGGTDGSNPYAGIVFDAEGNIYGTTVSGGKSNLGTVFELAAPVGKGSYREKVLWSFNGKDGSAPLSSVLLEGVGHLYGTTTTGGGTGCYGLEGCGVAFELIP
jgi:uncharacterized repeat protein (TIGR03803 family)